MKQGSTYSVHEIAAADEAQRPGFAVTWRPALMKLAPAMLAATASTRLVTPNKLAAIAARETDGLNVFQYGMARGPGCGVSPWQITSGVDWTNLAVPAYPGYGSLLDVTIAARVAAIEFAEPALEQFPGSNLAGFAAFNLGGGGVAQELAAGISPDAWTTEHDYGLDVFTSWINFAAVALGVNVDWASYAWPSS